MGPTPGSHYSNVSPSDPTVRVSHHAQTSKQTEGREGSPQALCGQAHEQEACLQRSQGHEVGEQGRCPLYVQLQEACADKAEQGGHTGATTTTTGPSTQDHRTSQCLTHRGSDRSPSPCILSAQTPMNERFFFYAALRSPIQKKRNKHTGIPICYHVLAVHIR